MVRHVDAIGRTDQSLIAITMTCRITNTPSTSGLKVHTQHHSPPLTTSSLMQNALVEDLLRNRRTLANNRRQRRHERVLPPLTHFGDHLTPAVLLSMNTGLRRGEVLKLRWGSVDFNRRLLTVEGRNAKSRQTGMCR